MANRLYMLVFLFSKMLSPISFIVFMLFYFSVYAMCLNLMPDLHIENILHFVTALYTPLLFIRFLMLLGAIFFISKIIWNVLVVGEIVIKRSTCSIILALCLIHIAICFAVFTLPLSLSNLQMRHQLHLFFMHTSAELITTVILGILLALYVGILGKENFRMDIGFIDDNN